MTDDHADIAEDLVRAAEGAVAIEAIWDGDTQGWSVCLGAVYKVEDGYRAQSLKAIRLGRDMRLFNAEVPPWPEAAEASRIGTALAQRLGVPFHFPAPVRPEEDCPHWWEVDQGVPCPGCGVLLLQRREVRWRGWCRHCHVERTSAAKEGALTPEERASRRCMSCQKPMVGAARDEVRCPACWPSYRANYREVSCTDCGAAMQLHRQSSDVPTCWGCLVVRLRSGTTPAERKAMAAGSFEDPFSGKRRIMQFVGCSDSQALVLMGVISSEGCGEDDPSG